MMFSCDEAPTRDSDKKVDVHILVVPNSQWKTDVRNTHLSTCANSISAGFVRVYPDTSLSGLRTEVGKQLDDSLLPEKYTLLRNVGHRLTWVSPKQEETMKARLFLPPLAPCPEIYVLDSKCLQNTTELPPVTNSKLKPRAVTRGYNYTGNSYCAGPCSTHPLYHCSSLPYPTVHWSFCHHGNCSPAFCSHLSTEYPSLDYLNTLDEQFPYSSEYGVNNSQKGSTNVRNSTSLRSHLQKSSGQVNPRGSTKTYPSDASQQNLAVRHPNGKASGRRYASSGRYVDAGTSGSAARGGDLEMSYSRKKVKTNPSSSQYRQSGLQASNTSSAVLKSTGPASHLSSVSRDQHSRYSQASKPQGYGSTMQRLAPSHLTQNASEQCTNTEARSTQKQRERAIEADTNPYKYGSPEVYVQPPTSHINSRPTGFNSTPSANSVGNLRAGGHSYNHGNFASKEASARGRGAQNKGEENDTNSEYGSSGLHVQPPTSHIDSRPTGFNSTPSANSGGNLTAGSYSYNHGNSESKEVSAGRSGARSKGEENGVSGDESESTDYSSCANSPAQQSRNWQGKSPNTTKRSTQHVNFHIPVTPVSPTGTQQTNMSDKDPPNSTRSDADSETLSSTKEAAAAATNKRGKKKPLKKQGGFDNQDTNRQSEKPKLIRQTRIASSSEPGMASGKGMAKQRERKNAYPPQSKLWQAGVTTRKNGGAPLPGTTRRIFSRENKTKQPKLSTDDKKLTMSNPKDTAGPTNASVLSPVKVTESPSGDTENKDTTKEIKAEAEPTVADVEQNKKPSRPTTAEDCTADELLGEIRKMKKECDELASVKGQLSSALRSIQLMTRTQREKYDNKWKRAYFQEKKTSTLLEEKVRKKQVDCQRIENQLDKIHARLYKGNIQKVNYNAKSEPPSEFSNVKIQCRRYQQDIEHLKSRLDTERVRLSAERKARNASVNDCKTLREELLRKKISHSRRKTEITT